MVIDVFTFNNELDILEIRLNILDPVVDKFVIIEARETFTGIPKPLYFEENKERFKKWLPKIVHYVVEEGDDELWEFAKTSPNVGSGEFHWVNEFYQKESIKKALTFLDYEDMVFVSDVDEIWDMEIPTGDLVYKPKQLPYLYYLNNRTDEDWLGWTGTIATKYKNIKDSCLNHLRTDDMTDYEVIENGGWHFNAIGGKEFKQDGFKHPVYESDWLWDNREVNMRKDEGDLPEYLIKNKTKWKKLFL